jgi:hypothetical protein
MSMIFGVAVCDCLTRLVVKGIDHLHGLSRRIPHDQIERLKAAYLLIKRLAPFLLV